MTITQNSSITHDADTLVESPPVATPPARKRGRAIASWVAVGAAVVAVGVLAVNVIDSDPSPRTLNLNFGVGDAKDNPNFGQVIAVTPTRQVTNLNKGAGDAKDDPNFGSVTPTRRVTNLNVGVGDAKDDPNFGSVTAVTPTRQVTNLNVGVGDAKDHTGFGE